jgi:hypothetical protein
MTVPSCSAHNTEKSGVDQAIVAALMLGLHQMYRRDSARVSLSANVRRVIEEAEPHFHQVRQNVAPRPFLTDAPEGLDTPMPFIQPGVSLRSWVRQMTAALVWRVTGTHDMGVRWSEAWVWSPNYFPGVSLRNARDAALEALQYRALDAELRDFPWWAGWSAEPKGYPPDIFRFEVCFLVSPGERATQHVWFRYRFYDSLTWYVVFETPPETKLRLMDAVGANQHSPLCSSR